MNRFPFGIDLGGTKTEGCVLGPGGDEILRHRVDTIKDSYSATIATITHLVQALQRRSGRTCHRLGVGIPGSVSPVAGLVRNANSTWINGRPFGRDLEAALGLPVRIENDANCLALSESFDGAARGAGSVFAVVLGTGVGGGLVINGRIHVGAHALAGEWGHTPLAGAPEGSDCFCGRAGCLETFLSGPALVRDYQASGGDPDICHVQQIAARALNGDAAAIGALSRHLARLGQALGAIVNIVDPEVIVLGGGLSNLQGLAEALPAVIAQHIFAPHSDRVVPVVRQARWGDSSGVRGAARLFEGDDR